MTDYAASLVHVPNTTILQIDRLMTAAGASPDSLEPSTTPISPIKSKSKGAKSRSRSDSKPESSSHSNTSSHLGTRLAFGAAATDPYAAYPDQLTNARRKANQRSDNSLLSAKAVSQFGSVVVGADITLVDRRNNKLIAEQKGDQRAKKERLAREKAARKAAGRFGDKEEYLGGGGRNDSISTTSLTGSNSSATRSSTDPSHGFSPSPFTKRHGRKYLRDTTLPYPLPCDLMELHRQTMLTMLLVQVFGGPVCTPNFQHKPPKKVLEIACGTGYWSSLCHQYFARQGHSVSFTGVDIAPLCPDMGREHDMKWEFVQHDLRKEPLPFDDEEFDLIMAKDLSLVVTQEVQHNLMDEYLRILHPGGSLEIWDGDHTLRMLLPQAPLPASSADSESESEDEEEERANATGTYTMTAQTKLTAPHNQYLHDYNGWIAKALEQKKLALLPCSHIRPLLLQESDLAAIESRRLAIPLGEVRWEREGIGSTISKDSPAGPSGSLSQTGGKDVEPAKKILSTGQAALRRTALLTVVQKIEALEPYLRDASGKSYDEWDRWLGGMMNDLMKQNGTSWGECLEVGAWWATKKGKKKP